VNPRDIQRTDLAIKSMIH